MSTNIPWVDKYRPPTLSGLVHHSEIVKTLKNIAHSGEMPNMLFYGPPGSGKTSAILALTEELFGLNKHDRVLELNASDDRGINTVRNDIITYAKQVISTPIKGHPCPTFKVIILDEADAMTPDAQSALRKIMEMSPNVKFCVICNYIDKIIGPIISRCMQFRFSHVSREAMNERLNYICKCENISVDCDVINAIIDISEGDLRRGVMMLQNSKYFSVKVDDVYDFAGYPTMDFVADIYALSRNGTICDIMTASKRIIKFGYSAIEFIGRLSKYVVMRSDIDDRTKAKIVKLISKTSRRLNEGSGELVQLMNVLAFINRL